MFDIYTLCRELMLQNKQQVSHNAILFYKGI